MEHLWKDAKQQLVSRQQEWDAERTALYENIARLRIALKDAGGDAAAAGVPPSLPPTNLAAALVGAVAAASSLKSAQGSVEAGLKAGSVSELAATSASAFATSAAASASAAPAASQPEDLEEMSSNSDKPTGNFGGDLELRQKEASASAVAGKATTAASGSAARTAEEQVQEELRKQAASISSMSSAELARRVAASAETSDPGANMGVNLTSYDLNERAPSVSSSGGFFGGLKSRVTRRHSHDGVPERPVRSGTAAATAVRSMTTKQS